MSTPKRGKHQLFAYYDNGINLDYDRTIRDAAHKYGGRPMGSGMFLLKPFTRDLQFAFFDRSNRSKAALEIQRDIPKARVEVEDEQ